MVHEQHHFPRRKSDPVKKSALPIRDRETTTSFPCISNNVSAGATPNILVFSVDALGSALWTNNFIWQNFMVAEKSNTTVIVFKKIWNSREICVTAAIAWRHIADLPDSNLRMKQPLFKNCTLHATHVKRTCQWHSRSQKRTVEHVLGSLLAEVRKQLFSCPRLIVTQLWVKPHQNASSQCFSILTDLLLNIAGFFRPL